MLQKIEIDRIIVHEVIRVSANDETSPIYGDKVLKLDPKGGQLICARLVNCLGSDSHCVSVTVEQSEDGSAFQHIAETFSSSDENFVKKTVALSDKLSRSQRVGSIKDGLAVFLQGVGWDDSEKLRWIAIIKADPDQGFVKVVKDGVINLQFVSDMVMGAQQRLLKVAFIVESISDGSSHKDPDDFDIHIYDHLMSNSGRGTASDYFYAGFLGCKLAENAAKETRLFFEKTQECLDGMSIDSCEKVEFRSHLHSYVKNAKQQMSVKEFAETYLPKEKRPAYLAFMKKSGLPSHAISKDIKFIKAKLKKQTLKFSSKVVIFATPEVLRESVKVIGVDRDADGEWTNLKIRGNIEGI